MKSNISLNINKDFKFVSSNWMNDKSDKSILITIITVTYNAENQIKRTIESVLSQSYNSIEYVIIDGESTDNTLNIINQYRDEIDYIQSKPDRGLYDAMNIGIDIASGDYVLFLNANDIFCDSNVIKDIVDFISKSLEEIDILYGNAIFELKDRNIRAIPKKIELLSREMIFSHQSVFVRTKILKQYKFDLKYKYVADYNQLSNIYIDGYKFHYYNRDISISATGSGVTFENTFDSVREHYSIPRLKLNPYSKVRMYRMLLLKKLVPIKAQLRNIFKSF